MGYKSYLQQSAIMEIKINIHTTFFMLHSKEKDKQGY